MIQHADLSDSGKYSCSPSNADVASVRVHVLNGKLYIILIIEVTREITVQHVQVDKEVLVTRLIYEVHYVHHNFITHKNIIWL